MKNKIFKIILISLGQWVIFYILISFYGYLFKIEKPNLSLGVTYYYYIVIVLPIVLFSWNLFNLIVLKHVYKVLIYMILIGVVVVYWINCLSNYPYRTLFILFASIGILLASLYFSYKINTRK